MKFNAKLGNFTTLSSGMKLPIIVDQKDRMTVLKDVYKFDGKPLIIDLLTSSKDNLEFKADFTKLHRFDSNIKIIIKLDEENKDRLLEKIYLFDRQALIVNMLIDGEEYQKMLRKITDGQRRKLFAIFNDICEWEGEEVNEKRKDLMRNFANGNGYEEFSLSDVDKSIAGEFIEHCLIYALSRGVPLNESEHPAKLMDSEKYMYLCLKLRKCAVCGAEHTYDRETGTGIEVQEHHVQTIGMGNNRQKLDDSNHKKASLCSICHSKAHNDNGGWESFSKKWHIVGVIYND
ncbi:putative HNHc nuclease [Orenia marismortui]|uniref:putative HNHc nuclease n=1 Tax=Orenia marismortui TaxID=46469 RepID=UPI00037338FE|nr:putative HNHc nuclease [Orenia marismortui]